MAGSDPLLARARNELGQFVADDPATPENEAWATESHDGGTNREVSA